MNREKKDQLPTMQVAFIDSICQPVYEVSEHYENELICDVTVSSIPNSKDMF